MKRAGAFALVLILAAGFASCSQSISVPPPSVPTSAQDFFWQPSQLTRGINYYVVRNGMGSNHLLTSLDGNHIEDGALNNEVTMIVHASMDSVVIDSMGTNSIFNLPARYYFGQIIPRDTMTDSLPADTIRSSLLILYRPDLDSGASWQAGILSGPGLGNGMPVIATVLDHVTSLRLPPVNAGADSAFGESFRIRYASENFSDSVSTFPIYWIAYFSRNVGPVLIQQYTLGFSGKYSVTQSAQIVGQAP